MELYPKEANCPHCGVRGEIRHVPAEVVPRRAFCGNCRVVFDYPVNRYDHILQDYDGDLNAFFFDPTGGRSPSPNAAARARGPAHQATIDG